MNAVRRLSVVSTIATLVLVTIGGLVRATKSGLGCGTDWPHCSGALVPEIANRTVAIEFSHRVAAGTVVLLLGALAVLAWRRRGVAPRVARGAALAFGLVIAQAMLGAVVVKLELDALSVVLHLALAMALLATLVYTTAAARAPAGTGTTGRDLAAEPDAPLARLAAAAAAVILVTLLVGSYVSGSGAGLAFADWPLMDAKLVPDLAVEAKAVAWTHRVLAATGGVLVALVAARARRLEGRMPLAARGATVALVAVVAQMLVGAANVWTRLDPAIVTVHLALAAIVWTALVVAVVAARAPAWAGAPPVRAARAAPALERSSS